MAQRGKAQASEHLARAKEYLAIAESRDSKREAYIKAADEIAAHKDEKPKETNENLARFLGVTKDRVSKLLRWRESGFKAETPYLMDDQATTRAARSHTKKVLADADERRKVLAKMPDKDKLAVANDALTELDRSEKASGRRSTRSERRANRAKAKGSPNEGLDTLVRLRLAKANRAIEDATRSAIEGEWTDEEAERLLERVARTEGLIDVLKMALHNTDDIDWDAELAGLVGEGE